jgi:nitrite reductase/ring-hydroxylating ferredoxin subunit
MRSTARFMNHAIHPALIPFPFAFLFGAAAFNVCGWLFDRPALWQTGGPLAVAGSCAAVLAAIPGLVDYLYTVPPRSTGRSRATRHGLANITAVALIFSSWWIRGGSAPAPTGLTLTLDILGAVTLSYAGWLGGTLVSRNLISVDHRYANAGKWQEVTVTAARGEAVAVGSSDDLEEGQMKLVRVNDKRSALARTPDGYAACDDRCTHRGGSLAGGVLIGGVVQCLWHGSQFECASGKVEAGPAKQPVKNYEVKVERGVVKIVF